MPEFYEWAIKTFEMNIHSQFVTDTDFLDISNLNKDNEYFYIVQNKLPYLNLPFPEIEDDIASKMLEDIFLRIDNKFMQIEKALVEINNKLENKSNI